MRLKPILFIILFSLSAVFIAAQAPKLPDTPAGKLIADYLKAFNSGDERLWREFLTTHATKSALEKVPIEDRMKRYREILSDVGSFEFRRVIESGQTSAQILALTKRGEEVQMTFELEAQPPFGLIGVRVMRNEAPGGAGPSTSSPPGQIVRNDGPRPADVSTKLSTVPVAPVVIKSDLAAKLDEYLTRMAAFGFSGSVLVAKDDQILSYKAYGMADRANKIVNTTDTLFDTGSIGKQFTGAAIFKLEAMGKLKTGDVIGNYLDNVPADKQAITLDHLLRHRSGLITSQNMRPGDDFSDRDRRVRQILEAPLNFQPGEQYQYNNAGYNLLAAITEKVSGQSYQQFLYDNLFKPAGMTSTMFQGGDFVVPGADKKTVARLYAGPEDNGSPLGRDRFRWFWTGPGGILTTPGDFYKWHRALVGDQVLPPAAKKKYYELAQTEGTLRNSTHGRVISHGGGTSMGTGASLVRYLDAGVMVGVCINNSGEQFNQIITRSVGQLIFEGEVPMPPAVTSLKADALAKVAGTYVLASGGKLTATVADGQLRLAAADAKGIEALFNTQPSERNQKLEERTSAIVEAYVKGHYEALIAALGTGVNPERTTAREQQRWKNWEASFGSFKSFTIVGTTPEPQNDAAVNVRLDFERGSVHTQYVWFPRGLDGVRILDSPPGIYLMPSTAREFVSYNLANGSLLRVTFGPASDKDITGLILHIGNSSADASRVK
jgi:CubicO group peptidase (beta-lactamase class C family)